MAFRRAQSATNLSQCISIQAATYLNCFEGKLPSNNSQEFIETVAENLENKHEYVVDYVLWVHSTS